MNTLKRGSLSKIYIVVLILVIGYVLYNIGGSLITSDYKYKDFLNDMKNKNVSEITIKQNKEIPTGKIIVKLKNDETKSVYVSDVNKVSDDIEEINNNVGTDIRPYLEDVSRDSIFLTTVLPMILLGVVVLIVFMMMNANANGGGGKMANFGKSRAKMVIDIKNMDFSKVAGLEEEKEELEEIVDFLKNPKKYIDLGARIPKGVLLEGPPGTGKTLLAKATAGEAKVPFFTISGSDFVEMFVGVGASRVRDLFAEAKKNAPCIVFIDEIDAIGSRRTSNSGAETENNQTLNQLLVEMDGFSSEETIIVLAATNRPEMLDQALLRPGRFDRQITIPAPDLKGRLEILKIHAQKKMLSDEVNLESIAEDTAGFTGAELANILNEAAIIATINKHDEIENSDIEEAVKKVTVGLEKKTRKYSDKDKKLTAYHEAGHAVVSRYLPTQTDVKEISIVPRGVAGGYTMYKSDDDKYYISKTEMQEKLIALLGGRAAEKLVLDDISTGASNDIEVATKIARDMVTKYGMSDTLGPIDFQGKEPYEIQMFGDKIGQEVKTLIDTAYNDALSLLNEHRDKLDLIANALLEKEKINEEDFKRFFN